MKPPEILLPLRCTARYANEHGSRNNRRRYLAQWDEAALQDMFSKNAELRNARQLARAITMTRAQTPLLTTGDLVRLAETVMKGERHKYLAQVFQALRIAVNDELNGLQDMLQDAADPSSRWEGWWSSAITLEDRIVKDALRPHEDDKPANMTGQKKSTTASSPESRWCLRQKRSKQSASRKCTDENS